MVSTQVLIVANKKGVKKVAAAIAKWGGTSECHAVDSDTGEQIWGTPLISERDFGLLAEALSQASDKTYRAFVINTDGDIDVIGGKEGCLSENAFAAHFLHTAGIKVVEEKAASVKAALESRSGELGDINPTIADGVATFRFDTAKPLKAGMIFSQVIAEAGLADNPRAFWYTNHFGPLNRKVNAVGELDSRLGDYCGPFVVIAFKMPDGAEGIINPSEGGLVWL